MLLVPAACFCNALLQSVLRGKAKFRADLSRRARPRRLQEVLESVAVEKRRLPGASGCTTANGAGHPGRHEGYSDAHARRMHGLADGGRDFTPRVRATVFQEVLVACRLFA